MVDILLYILATLLANYTATWFIPLPIFGLVAVGTFAFGATFTLRDRVHHRGRRVVYAMILAAAVANVCESLLLGIPLRIIAASFMSIIIAEGCDTEVYHHFRHLSWVQRVARSNVASIPLDTILFTCLAFVGIYPTPMLVAIIFGDMIAKAVISAIVAVWRVRDNTDLLRRQE